MHCQPAMALEEHNQFCGSHLQNRAIQATTSFCEFLKPGSFPLARYMASEEQNKGHAELFANEHSSRRVADKPKDLERRQAVVLMEWSRITPFSMRRIRSEGVRYRSSCVTVITVTFCSC